MKPVYLLSEELNYELRIRGVVTTRKDAACKRKMLSRAISRDHNRDIKLVDPEYKIETEKVAINNTLEQIRALIPDFDGPPTDSGFKRIETRLIHITNRVNRIDVPTNVIGELDQEVLTFKNESYATCLELEALLYDKVQDKNDNINEVVPSTSYETKTIPATLQYHPPSRKSVPVYKWNLHFSGENNMSVKSFLDRVEELRIARNVEKDELFSSATDLFSGNALLWFRSIRSSLKDWDSLVTAIKSQFLPLDYDDRLWDEIRQRTQSPKEPIHVYVAIMETLFNRLERPVQEVTKLKYIRKNMLPHYNLQLALTPINSSSELVQLCHKIDEATSTKNSYRLPPNAASLEPELACVRESKGKDSVERLHKTNAFENAQSSVSKNTKRNVSYSKNKDWNTVVCWNCGLQNHVFRDCKSRMSKFCFKCGRPNETVRTCSCSKNV